MRLTFSFSLLLLLFAAEACAAASASRRDDHVDDAKGPNPFKVELADDSASQEKGLMFRKTHGAECRHAVRFPHRP